MEAWKYSILSLVILPLIVTAIKSMKTWFIETMERLNTVEKKVGAMGTDYQILSTNLNTMKFQLERIEELVNKLLDIQLKKDD